MISMHELHKERELDCCSLFYSLLDRDKEMQQLLGGQIVSLILFKVKQCNEKNFILMMSKNQEDSKGREGVARQNVY